MRIYQLPFISLGCEGLGTVLPPPPPCHGQLDEAAITIGLVCYYNTFSKGSRTQQHQRTNEQRKEGKKEGKVASVPERERDRRVTNKSKADIEIDKIPSQS